MEALLSARPIDPRMKLSPRVPWSVILALQIATVGLFGVIWLVVQSLWVKQRTGKKKAFVWSLINLFSIPIVFVFVLLLGFSLTLTGHLDGEHFVRFFGSWFQLGFAALNFAAVFVLRSELESRAIGMKLNRLLTMVLGTVYIQYHLNKYVLSDVHE